MSKKFFLIYFVFLINCLQAQNPADSYVKDEIIRLKKLDSIEKKLQNYIKSNSSKFKISKQEKEVLRQNLHQEFDSLDVKYSNDKFLELLNQIKEDKLRNKFFNKYPETFQFYTAKKVPENLAITCINGGFEEGNAASYSFRSILASATPIQHLEDGCSVVTNNGVFNVSLSPNQYADRATLVTPGNEPFLAGLGININQVHTGNYSLKLNPNPFDATSLQIGNVTSVYKDVLINDSNLDFNYLHFGYVVPNLTHLQPFFRYRIYGLNATGTTTTGILREVCIPMNYQDCRYERILDNRYGSFTLAYTPRWVCERINTSDLIGQNVRIEFTISDCEFRGHFSSVYIDNLCGYTCPPLVGSVQTNSLNLECPNVPITVCGSFVLPNQSTLGGLTLSIVNSSGAVVQVLSNPVINNLDYCFTVLPTDFGLNPAGTYSYFTTIQLNNNQCVNSIVGDITGNISFNPKVNPIFTQVAPICEGDQIASLPLFSNNGIEGSWFPALSNTTTTTYTFTPADFQCANSVQMTIVVIPKVLPTFNGFATLCYGEPFILPTSSLNSVTGSWSPIPNPFATTTYTFTPDINQCAFTTNLVVPVFPDFDFDFKSYCQNEKFHLEIVANNNSFDTSAAAYEWKLNSNVISNDVNFNVTDFLSSLNNQFQLPLVFHIVVTNQNGCVKEKSITVENVYCGIPNGISVNNDGLNDSFDLSLLGVKNLKIFNRYGMLIFEKDNYINEWYGQTNEGKKVPDGVYFYQITLSNKEIKTGWVYLIR